MSRTIALSITPVLLAGLLAGSFAGSLAGCGNSTNPGGGGDDSSIPPADLTVVKPADMTKMTPKDMSMPVSKDMAFDGPCDVLMQDCPDPAKKCTLIYDDQMQLIPRCVPITGMNMLGDACKRVDVDMGVPGYDNCALGLFCSSNGSLAANLLNRHCRSFCRADSDCKGAKTQCLGLTTFDGLCVPTCTPFGNDCTNGYDCSVLFGDIDMMKGFAACRQPGNVAVGAACKPGSTDCVTGALCIDPAQGMNTKCYALCDTNHACGVGMCVAVMGFQNGLGFCM